jgi:hypothetical protein
MALEKVVSSSPVGHPRGVLWGSQRDDFHGCGGEGEGEAAERRAGLRREPEDTSRLWACHSCRRGSWDMAGSYGLAPYTTFALMLVSVVIPLTSSHLIYLMFIDLPRG